jgi:hypothetical protein
MTKHIVCYSGGHSSALVAIEVARKYGVDSLVLLNHDINSNVEDADIKRFKVQVSNYLGVPITYANYKGLPVEEIPDQFDVTVLASAFKVGSGSELCTSRLKTEPFKEYLDKYHPNKDCVVYYGFDANEKARIQRRSGILGAMGYKSDYPLALWERTIQSTKEIGIEPPMQYNKFKHANCIGCLKAGKQHWYIVYCERPDVWEKAKWAEDEIGYTIIPGDTLEALEPVFDDMRKLGIPCTEHMDHRTFWSMVRKSGIDTSTEQDRKPCECIF